MSVILSTAAANGVLASFITATSTAAGVSIDGQSGFGFLVIGNSSLGTASSGANVLATLTLQKPSFAISSGIATLNGVPFTVNPSANGTAALANFFDSGSNLVITGLTVGISGTDIIVPSVTIQTTVALIIASGRIVQ